ncbi:MAG: SBBP repeat-containing protein [Ignavibacteria bacterium]|nr:SBBP repeat-containing protein [Ignavibacteria bacterium]
MKDKERAMDRRGHVIGINFIGASAATTARGIDPQPGYHNYFIGNDKTKWASNVALYGRAEVHGLYPGVDAVFYLDGGKPRYDLVVHPGANTSQIRMTIEGAKSVKVNAKGSLSIQTSMGVLEQRGLYAYQDLNGKRQQVECSFKVDGKRTVAFNVGKYDPSHPLVIDPLVYSTYLAGRMSDLGYGIAVDGSNNAYITGYTQSTNFPTTTGAYQSSHAGGIDDAFVTKLNSNGSTLAYSTYIGGNDSETGRGIAVDGSGNAYVTGNTRSKNFPTSGAYQSSNGGRNEAFVTNSAATERPCCTLPTSVAVGTSSELVLQLT